MANLIINRVRYELSEERPNLYASKKPSLLFRMQFRSFKQRFVAYRNSDFDLFFEGVKESDFVYYGFSSVSPLDEIILSNKEYPFQRFEPKFIREQLILWFKNLEFIVEPYPKAWDLSVYKKLRSLNNDWSFYRRYDLKIHSTRKEIAFNIGSETTLISETPLEINLENKAKFIDVANGTVRGLNAEETTLQGRVIANRLTRLTLLGNQSPRKLSYKNLFSELNNFYNTQLSIIRNSYLHIELGGLRNVDNKDAFKVNLTDNQMMFGNSRVDINAVSGVRNHGVYRTAPKALENKFVFIYGNRDDANQLYLYFKNGYKHFPGLWSYVGIPPTLDPDKKLQYDEKDIGSFKNRFDKFMEEEFPNSNYDDYFAIIIEPFSSQERQDLDDEEPEMYYYVKEKFLAKSIPSQFIHYKNIRSGSFHYFLPNIAIGILAKLGGIPWKLKSKRTEELVVGFNQKFLEENRFIGSAVFFTNEGDLGRTFGFPEVESEKALINNLRTAIEQFQQDKSNPPQRLVIHYYKPQSGSEQRSIEKLIQDELNLNIPFAIVEINDTKSQMDICFDNDFDMGMPESGTYIRVGKQEYLLFNNTRYQTRPVNTVLDELPIKISIHFADTGGFSHKDLISQVYEFSRLYWKGLKQRSQPATTIYAKLIADFTAHFDGVLPNNHTVQNTPWFL